MRKKYPIIILLIIAFTLSACEIPSGSGATTVFAQSQPAQRTLNVTGSGMVTLTPDMAYVSIGVRTENPSARIAINENNTNAQLVIDVIKDFNVDELDVQTTNFSVYSSRQYDQFGNPTGVIIYTVDNTVYITVRTLDELGELLDAVVQAGANEITGISFDVADKSEALSQARRAAVEDAHQKAEELVSAAHVILGDVQTISYYDSTPSPVYVEAPAAMERASSVPIQSGSMQITTSVAIVYEIR